ncbi:tumor necrosis factor receptor superfamily member 5 [Cololabis saira]|uniref:tumor necrosis factor receptor superfamily member 5 n=1 Tax=Cololabis saira TaxID=129043 RepID=UPI002AD4322D|nr:tumor necrosis factor receptor superfamily member 5 [Cololabis saira]
MFPSRSKRPDMLLFVAVAGALLALAAAQPRCDPLTQYVDMFGQCCNLCGPGTKMRAKDSCTNPTCENCGEGEYQDKYNRESKCKLQPYCDPNKNFDVTHPKDKTTEAICMCKRGFHCSSMACITCVSHKACPAGSGVVSRGNQTHDTECRTCQHGKFSNVSSKDAACQEWKKCSDGYEVEEEGTDVSDTVCAGKMRSHWIVIIVVSALVGVAAVALFAWKLFKNKSRFMKETTKGCVECLGPESEAPKEEEPLKTPVEEDEDCHGMSENGNFVTQELGKVEVLSRQESQMETMCEIVSF